LSGDFAAVAVAYLAGHYAGDYWAQTQWQALTKGKDGREGRLACAAHVAVYTVVLAAFLALTAGKLGMDVTVWRAVLGLGVSAATHYAADRREPLRKLAVLLGKGEWWDSGGAPLLDQSWHLGWLFGAALLTAG
jgi:hypothetical protein